jgi:arabinofuranosyltransferase
MRALFHADPNEQSRTLVGAFWVLLLCALVAWAYVRTAAVTEDAFITFRVVDNALNGYGLVWNVGERVQVFTHPLWALLLVAFSSVSGNIFHTALALSLVLTIICAALIARNSAGLWTALWAVTALLLSEAFVEYSSASLENALAHALVAALVFAWARFAVESGRRAWVVALFAGLLVITRHDFAVLVGPATIALLLRARGRDLWLALVAASLPLVLWSIFSLVYYGSLWPNSAYAKLNNGMSVAESFRAAEPYFRDLIQHDAVTALVIAVAAIRGLLQGSWRMRPLAFGLVLYVLYLGSAGGDYMGGRLFSTPFVMAVAMLTLNVRLRWWWNAQVWILVTLVLGSHRGWIVKDVHPHAEPRPMSQHSWMYPYTGWRAETRRADFSNMPWGEQGLKARAEKHEVVAKCAVGLYGFSAGPGVHIVDPLAIGDGFLSRLPSKKPSYPGHFERAFPEGYVETVTLGKNALRDPSLRVLYEKIRLVETGPLFDSARLNAIWALNTGAAKELTTHAQYDPNLTVAPGLTKTSTDRLSCMGQLDPLLTVRLK